MESKAMTYGKDALCRNTLSTDDVDTLYVIDYEIHALARERTCDNVTMTHLCNDALVKGRTSAHVTMVLTNVRMTE